VDGPLEVFMQKNLLHPLEMQNNFHSPVFLPCLFIRRSMLGLARGYQSSWIMAKRLFPPDPSAAASESCQRCGSGGPMSRDFKFMIVLMICLIWITIVGYIGGVPW